MSRPPRLVSLTPTCLPDWQSLRTTMGIWWVVSRLASPELVVRGPLVLAASCPLMRLYCSPNRQAEFCLENSSERGELRVFPSGARPINFRLWNIAEYILLGIMWSTHRTGHQPSLRGLAGLPWKGRLIPCDGPPAPSQRPDEPGTAVRQPVLAIASSKTGRLSPTLLTTVQETEHCQRDQCRT